jgi:DNA repair exonuclease SbcCD nuclease subunit
MIRTKNIIQKTQPDFIFTADWHLQEGTPVCRLDDFWETQWEKVDFITKLANEFGIPVIHSGDLFDYWKPSPYLLSKTMEHLPKEFYTVFGNHDLPQHNMDLKDKSGVWTLFKAGKLHILPSGHWGQDALQPSLNINGCSIAVYHVMTYQGKKPWPGCTSPMAAKLLRKYPYDLIVTGDNHVPFVEKYENRLLVNPGSIFRLEAGQINHKPRIYLYYSKDNTVEPIYLPIKNDVISREHIEIMEKRNERIDAFVSSLNTQFDLKLSFEKNLEKFQQDNQIDKKIIDIVYKLID